MNDCDYKPLSAYGAIGSMYTAALVGNDGSVDWCCLPELDSPSVFAALLDNDKGGRWRIGAGASGTGTQRYLERTNVLETTFVEPTGTIGVIDFMPYWEGIPDTRAQSIVRIVEGHTGEVPVEMEFAPHFDYARGPTRLAAADGGLVASGDEAAVRLWGPEPIQIDGDRATGRWVVRPGDRLAFVLRYTDPGHEVRPIDAFDAFNRTVEFWRDWVHHCNPDLCPFGGGPWHDMVLRSELVLKLLSHHETGAISAALTTSLPEEIGGERNWDYRYAWIRDASFTVHALYHLGHHGMLHDFIGWIRDSALDGNPVGHLSVLYTLHGKPPPPEHTLDHLEGYCGSRPVRVGNLAAEQQQLDIYGEILDAAYQVWRYDVETPDDELAAFLATIADHVCEVWHNPDCGIWEVRTEPRHFVYSKVMCWVALDRAVRLAEEEEHPLSGDVDRWKREREAIRASILENGVDPERGTFVQSYGSRELDAALLLIPILGFLPVEDPRVERTIDAIETELVVDDLVIRYLTKDGLLGIEGAFAWCTFWLIDCMAMQGRLAEAEELFRKMLSRANPVGLMSEEIHLETGQLLGNFPQAFTHLGVINSALFLNSMKGRVEEGPAARPGAPV
ncbi:MAG: glycoside hydrolase family 15 protein [Gemmatimonadota bacterium]